ncbi:MAG TPA: Csp1 family four helix bundle copper storage protein [Candidatus Eisenbacteria bacterium]|nr:Csp1 family four helix bundle copper storage protein [Candidatus Eisenbacteria bacterium]
MVDGDRRRLLKASGALLVVGAMQGPGLAKGAPAPASGGNPELVDAAGVCARAGEACLAHCLSAFAAGDTSLARCATLVQQMIVGCDAIAKLAAHGSAHLAAFVAACRDVCADCEVECRKHEAHHEICKRCADACAAFVKVAART